MTFKLEPNLSYFECFLKVKEAGYKYAGLSDGNLCSGDNTFGSNGATENIDCNTPC